MSIRPSIRLLASPPRVVYLFVCSIISHERRRTRLTAAAAGDFHPRTNPGGSGTPLAQPVDVSLSVNGAPYRRVVEPRLLLSDFLRGELGLTGTHVGCEHGVCGACTVLMDGEAVRSCLVFAVQADGAQVVTVEGLDSAGELHPLQEAFRDAHGLQCGFCTPGILMSMIPFLRDNPHPDEPTIREALSGNLCRCTGYQNIVQSVALAAERMRGADSGAVSPAEQVLGS
ncbi:MAG TPA: (2Fe-2S)-binding protein [Longimicrobium sp.]|nr:(2Fe-2S)-binding protein [Longimicrobium sp.]